MADASDVEAALVGAVAAALYPRGAASGSVTGFVVRVYRGAPSNTALEADLAAGISHVAVAMVAGSTQATDQVPAVWEYPQGAAATLTGSVAGAVAGFAGKAAPGQLAGLLVDDAAFAYRTQQGDTPELVAASLAALVGAVRAATSAGASVTVPGATRLVARVVVDQPALMQTRRQAARFRLTCWCGDPASRDALASVVDGAVAQLPFVALADGSVGRVQYAGSDSADDLATLPAYRRMLDYTVEYATTLVQTQPCMLFGIFGVGSAASPERVTLS